MAYCSQMFLAAANSRALQADILASVPQHLSRGKRSGKTSLVEPLGASRLLKFGGGYNMICPLYNAGDADIAADDARRFVINVLRGIGNNLGIRLALLLADRSEPKARVNISKQRPVS